MPEKEYADFRCPHCKRLLFRFRVVASKGTLLLLKEEVGEVKIKCERCKSIVGARIAEEYRKCVK